MHMRLLLKKHNLEINYLECPLCLHKNKITLLSWHFGLNKSTCQQLLFQVTTTLSQ